MAKETTSLKTTFQVSKKQSIETNARRLRAALKGDQHCKREFNPLCTDLQMATSSSWMRWPTATLARFGARAFLEVSYLKQTPNLGVD